MTKDENLASESSFLNPLELAELLRLSRASVYRLVEGRKISFHRLPRGLRFSRRDIDGYLQKCRVESLEDVYEREKNKTKLVG